MLDAAVTAAYNIHRARGKRHLPAEITRLLRARNVEEGAMEQTMLEYLTKVGREMEREKQLDDALSSLRKILRRLKIDPNPYEACFAKLVRVGQVTDISFGVATAKDPAAYLRRRLCARPARARPRRRAAAKA